MGDDADILRKARQVVARLAPIGVCGPRTLGLIDGASFDTVQIPFSALAADCDFAHETAASSLCAEHRLTIGKRK